MPPSSNIAEFRAVLRNARNPIVVAGAGLSAASGIPTFRGAGGMWRSLDAMSLATPEAFEANPSLVWQFYHYRREKALAAKPNAAHVALAKLSIPRVLRTLAPKAQSFHIITQNVDGLSTRALRQVEATQRLKSSSSDDLPNADNLIEMHGRLFDVRCTLCQHTVLDFSNPLTVALGEADRRHADIIEAGKHEAEIPIPVEDLPTCVECGGLARPGVVWFGESIPLLPVIEDIVEESDLCLVIGTSSQVQPAASLAEGVKDNGGHVAVFNIERTKESGHADFYFLGGCEEELPRALGLLEDDAL